MIVEAATMTVNQTKFSIVKVKPCVLKSPDIELTRQSFQMVFGKVPIILTAPDSHGNIQYHGRSDIVNFLAAYPPSKIPWTRYSVV